MINFKWQNKQSLGNGLWALDDFLTTNSYNLIKHEIRSNNNIWTSKYANRLLCEHNDFLNCIEFGARLIPYLSKLINEPVVLNSVRAYIDLSGSAFYPHFDAKEFVINVQLYLTEIDYPELGTQFMLDPVKNQEIELNGIDHMLGTNNFVQESDYYTIPFKTNCGYINDNRIRKLHKTLTVPPGKFRESLHLNFGRRIDDKEGLESVYYFQQRGMQKDFDEWRAKWPLKYLE